MATTIGNLITLDGQFTDWPATDSLMTPDNFVAGYQVYGALLNDTTLGNTYVFGIDTTSGAAVIGVGTTIYLNTDQNTATGYSPAGAVGAEYEVQFSTLGGTLAPYLYSLTATGTPTLLNGGAPLNFAISSDGKSVELAVPQSLLTPSGGAAPHSISFNFLSNNGAVALPSDFSKPEYNITDPSTLIPVDHSVKKVAIVYSATTAAQYFGGGAAGQTAYADLFMAAQHQAQAAGVSYDILTEADLTNVAKMAQYSALIFPDMQNVQSSQAAAIESALHQVVYDYHVPIITAGQFMTNDQTGAAFAAPYAAMQSLLDLTQSSFGTATYSVTADATALANHNSVVSGYGPGELIGGASGQFAGTTAGLYTNTGYLTFSGVTKPATVLADINIQGGASVAGVVQTTTGATNTHFATTGLLGDSNLLQHAIQNAVFGTTPSLTLDITRMAGVVDSRTDLDQSQFPADVSPAGKPGIYDVLLPILQQWKQQYNFVGSYYANIGDNANPANNNSTNWAVSAPIYKALIAMGNEFGTHSYTHLINPPTIDANGNPVPTATWDENTNTLYVTPPANGSAPNWTFAYEFGQSKTIFQQQLGITLAGTAVPGASDTAATAHQILQYFPTTPGGLTGYVSGGWTGVGSGYPNAFGYLSPNDTNSVYIAPNITFDFTEIQFDKKTPAQALADWETLFNQLSANSDTPVIVWPWHDYGPTDWNTSGTTTDPGYTSAMFTNFIAYAYNKGYEFVTSEDLAARIAAEQKATLSETTSGNVITAKITPDPTALDLGAMALNVTNGGTQVIQNAGNWYAYDSHSVFLPYGGGTFTVTLGTTQDDVTHIDALPMRADLKSVTGNGSNLAFSMTGDGVVDVHVKTPGTNIVSIQGAPTATLNGDDLSLTFNDGALALSATSPQGTPVLHNVTITDGATAVETAGNDIIFGGSGTTDTVTWTGAENNYAITYNAATQTFTVSDHRAGSPDGTDTVSGIENFKFSDATYASSNFTTAPVTIESFGSTSLLQQGSYYELGVSGPMLKDGGAPAVSGSLVAIGAEQTASGFDVAWKMSGADSYTVWTTDANGNHLTNLLQSVSGAAVTLENLELTFHQDLNGDGRIGVLTTLSDFDGNHKADILWQNSDGTIAVWNDGQLAGAHNLANAGVVPSDFHIVGSGDFDGNGRADILWQREDGTVSIWDDGQISSAHWIANPGVVPSSWHIAGIGDFDGNGRSDILWQNSNGAVSLWDNGQISSAHWIANPGVVPSSWHIAGTGDFDGNGHTDILWQNDNGAVSIWDNGQIGSAHIVAAAGLVASTWHIVGTGDFNGDGRSDILWQNDNGAVSIWDNGQIGSAHIVAAAGVVASSWHIAGIGDFDGNGFADIQWRNDNGAVSIWDNGQIGSAHIVANAGVMPSTWHVGADGVTNEILTGGSGNTILSGGPGTNTLIAGPGNDLMSGGPGADTFVFAPVNPTVSNGVYHAGFGNDVITDFTASSDNINHDVLQFASSMFATGTTATSLAAGTAHNAAGGLVALAQHGSDVVITVDPTDTITLSNVSLTVLKASAAADFHLV